MNKGIFIAGVGTDTGKTFIAALIIKKLRSFGINAGYYKAAVSGGSGDAEYVCKIAGLNKVPHKLLSYIYELPVSPHLAANIEQNNLKIEKISEDFENMKKEFDFITMEGSGGLICPLKVSNSEIIMQTDIIKSLNLDIILCVPSELGTLNSTILTSFYANHNDLKIKGIIMNNFEEDNFLHLDNKKMIEKLTGISVIACVPKDCNNLIIEENKLIKLYGDV